MIYTDKELGDMSREELISLILKLQKDLKTSVRIQEGLRKHGGSYIP